MNRILVCCLMLVLTHMHAMEPDIPDQKMVKNQMALVAHACFKNYPNLTKRQQDDALTALAEVYNGHENHIIRDLNEGKLKNQDKYQLCTSVINQIEGRIDRAIKNAEYDEAYFKREEQEQETLRYLTRLMAFVVLMSMGLGGIYASIS